MKIENINNDIAKECLLILSYCDKRFVNNIPCEVLITLNELAANSLKDFYIDKNKDLIEQNISTECRELLSYIFYQYMAK